MSIGAAFAFVIFPPDCGMTLLVSELVSATRAKREAVEQGGSPPVCLSICVQRAALKTPPTSGRTLSFPESAARLSRGADSCPQASWVPFRRFYPVAEGVGRDGIPVGQACTADSGQTKRNGAKHHVQQSHPHRPPRTERRSQNRSEQPRVVVLNIATQESWKNDKGEYETRTEWHRVFAWRNFSKFAKTLQKGQLITLEGTSGIARSKTRLRAPRSNTAYPKSMPLA